MRALVLLLFFSVCVASESPSVSQLADDDFDKREEVTEQLSQLPEEYASKFLRQSCEEGDPEIRYRLRIVAYNIFLRTILRRDDRWRRLHGWLGMELSVHYDHNSPESQNMRGSYKVDGFHIDWIGIDTPADCGKISTGDIILQVNGMDIADLTDTKNYGYGWEKLGDTFKLKVMHFVEGIDSIVEVTVTAVETPEYKVNFVSDEELYHELWDGFRQRVSLELLWSRCRRFLFRCQRRLSRELSR